MPATLPTTATVETLESWSAELDLRELTDRFGTPLYLTHRPTLEAAFAAWTELVGEPSRVLFPVKANPSPPVLALLASLGGGADCASRDEVQAALEAGVAIEHVSYNTPAFDAGLAAEVVRAGGTAVADSADGLADLAGRLGEEGFAGRVFVRVNPGALPGYKVASEVQRYTDHGSASSQFGIPSEEVVDLLAGCPVPVTGLHVHVGTQMDNLDTFAAGLGFLHHLVDLLHRDAGRRIATVNLGGGLGIPFLPGQEFPTVEALTQALRPHLRRDLVYEVEPGNALVGRAGALLTRLVAIKRTRGRRWGIVDAGTDQLVKHTVARWEHNLVDADGRSLPRQGPDALAGPLCFAGDVLLPETNLEGLEPGDPLLVQHAGSYCEAVSSRFNGRRSPAHVWIDGDGAVRKVRISEDPFFAPPTQTWAPPGLLAAEGERLELERVAPLQSGYMHREANDDRYEVREVTQTGPGSYRFVFDTQAAVGFVAMPFALRMAGDASITAVGLELGWAEKPGPVWATRLTMSCCTSIPAGGPVPCSVVVSPLAPSLRQPGDQVGLVRYRLGENGEVSGVARVVVPGARFRKSLDPGAGSA